MEPVAVAARLIAQGGEDEQDEKHVEGQQPLPVFLHEQLKIHVGAEDVDDDAQQDGDQLNDHLSALVLHIPPGGGINEHHSKTAGQKAQRQQKHIAFFPKLLQGRKQCLHGRTSLS